MVKANKRAKGNKEQEKEKQMVEGERVWSYSKAKMQN